MKKKSTLKIDPRAEALLQGRLHDPFAYLGPHSEKDIHVVRVFQPYAIEISLVTAHGNEPLQRVHPDGLFEWRGSDSRPHPYQLRITENIPGMAYSADRLMYDPYAFAPQISSFDLHLFNEGNLHQGYRVLGSHARQIDGISGVRFAVWAPNAERVSVVGEFNRWDGRINPMAVHGSSGVWELFIPGYCTGRTIQIRDIQPRGEIDGKDRSLRQRLRAAPRHRRPRRSRNHPYLAGCRNGWSNAADGIGCMPRSMFTKFMLVRGNATRTAASILTANWPNT